MADTWWHEEAKVLIASWDEEAVNDFYTMPNKKLVWDQVSQGMAEGGTQPVRDNFLLN